MGDKICRVERFFFLKKYSMFMIMEYTLLLAFYHEPNNFLYSTSKNGTWSSVVFVSEGVEDLTQVNVTLLIDKSVIFPTQQFNYRKNPRVKELTPNCSFSR